MQLLMSPVSPFVRKVRVVLRETGLIDRVTEVNVTTTPMASDPSVIAANPTGKIPALIRDDGPAIYDSRVITRFLDAEAKANFYPASRLWDVLTIEATADAVSEAAVLMVYELRFRAPESQSADWVEAQWGKIARALATLNDRWMSHLAGPLDAGQIAVACALSYLDLRHDERGWRAENAMLADWHATFVTRPSMVDTDPQAG
jgi:glutathione S-transferase